MLAFLVMVTFVLPLHSLAQEKVGDADNDALNDSYEEFFGTDPLNSDTDTDGYTDYYEIIRSLDPHAGNGAKLTEIDTDGDVLWDYEEIKYGTDPQNPDTDGDGFKDKVELINGYDPNGEGTLPQWIEIDLSDQTLRYGQGPKVFNTFPVSTGMRGYSTPTGEFSINKKVPLAWSNTYKLYMPYWMSFIGNMYGIHELPYWPGGYREGADHLGKPVSHGCVRLGIGPAKKLYAWAEVGTKVVVKQ